MRALYELAPAPMPFGTVPWPDDAYLDERGRVRVRDIPSEASEAYGQTLAAAMADLDGFGIRPTVYFPFDGELDPESLPASAEQTLAQAASVFLIDADTSSPRAFERIAAEVDYAPDSRQIRLRPAFGRPLNPGRLYAAVVTSSVEAADGRPVAPAERFLAIRDAQAALSDPLERAVRARHLPVLETLAARGLPRHHVVSLAVFRVQSVRTDLTDARALVRAADPGAAIVTTALGGQELDSVLGVPIAGSVGLDAAAPHEHIGFMVHGRFASPNLMSPRPMVHGAFERDDAGLLQVQRTDEVPFTIFLPQGLTAGARLPVVIVAHDLEGERSDALALANALCASGYAVVAPDAPFHGLRSGAGDRTSRFTDAATADGFGDLPGDFFGVDDAEGALVPAHPFYYRDALRQAVVDLMQLVFLLGQGDWSELQAAAPALDQLELETARVGFVGLGLGADVGTILGAVEPELGALVLAFPHGFTIDSWARSPEHADLAEAVFTELGVDAGATSLEQVLRLPQVDAWRTLADRASAIAHAPALRRLPVNVLQLLAKQDEVAHSAGAEALAHALGAVMIAGAPQHVPQLMTRMLQPGETLSTGGAVSRVLYLLNPATHSALTHARGCVEHEHPLSEPPFMRRSPVAEIDNPIIATLMQVAFFFESYRACPGTTPASCVASVAAPVPP